MSAAAEAIACLVRSGWVSADALRPTVADVSQALSGAPAGLVDWVSAFSSLSSPDDAVWFLSLDDCRGRAADAFSWNAFAMLSIEAAASEGEIARIREYWRAHVPILLSVRDHYSYLAVRADGAVVHGEEPEFEESTVVATSFAGLLESLISGECSREGLVGRLLFGS